MMYYHSSPMVEENNKPLTVGGFNAFVDTLAEHLNKSNEHMCKRFEDIEQKLEKMDQRSSQIEQGIEHVESSIKHVKRDTEILQ